VRRRLLTLIACGCAALLCAACAQGGAPAAGSSGVNMYGTIDTGISLRK
jgi:predicted porin